MRPVFTRLVRSDVGRNGAVLLIALLLLNASTYVFCALAGLVLPLAYYGVLMFLVSLMLVLTAPAMIGQNSLSKVVAIARFVTDTRREARRASGASWPQSVLGPDFLASPRVLPRHPCDSDPLA